MTTQKEEEEEACNNNNNNIPLIKNSSKNDHPYPLICELKSILSLTLPMSLTGFLLYSRSLISMLFLGRLGALPLAGGSLAIGFANISGYSILSGLSMGMEPICGQAFGAGRHRLLAVALHRTIVLLLVASCFVVVVWVSMQRLLLLCRQDADIAGTAQLYIFFSIPDLVLQSFIHPIRIFLRSQSRTAPLAVSAAVAAAIHVPVNYLLVSVLGLGVRGVALANVWTNFNLLAMLIVYVRFSGVGELAGVLRPTSGEVFENWKPLLALAVPSCISVCLEWWWYEIMVLLCGLLMDPKTTVASMGILIQTTSLIYIFPSSLSFGISTRVGNELGANSPSKACRAATVGLICSFVLSAVSLGFTLKVKDTWATMFTSDQRIIKLTAIVLPIVGLCELGNCPQTAGCGVLRGCARPRTAANVNLWSFYGVGTPVAVVLAFLCGFDFVGLWLGLLAAQGTCVASMVSVIMRMDWQRQAKRAQWLTGSAGAGDDDDDGGAVEVVIDAKDEIKRVDDDDDSEKSVLGHVA